MKRRPHRGHHDLTSLSKRFLDRRNAHAEYSGNRSHRHVAHVSHRARSDLLLRCEGDVRELGASPRIAIAPETARPLWPHRTTALEAKPRARIGEQPANMSYRLLAQLHGARFANPEVAANGRYAIATQDPLDDIAVPRSEPRKRRIESDDSVAENDRLYDLSLWVAMRG